MDYTNIKLLIETNPEHSHISFGSEETAPSGDWIRKTEMRLGLTLPKSYKWFLQNHGGGEVNGDEIFSIYQADGEIAGGDLIYQYQLHRRVGSIEGHEIPIMSTDFGELFLLDTSVAREDNEYPVYVKRGENKQLFAENFIEFLTKIITQKFE